MKRIFALVLTLIFALVVYANTHVIISNSTSFSPDSISIDYGDTIIFQLDPAFNAQEVSQTTWNANDSIPVVGFRTLQGGGMVVGLSPGTHYYVSDSNAYMGMKGRILVSPPATVKFAKIIDTISEASLKVPVLIEVNNPTTQSVRFTASLLAGLTTATPALDFTYSNRVFIKQPGNSMDTVYINVLQETLIENTEIVSMHFTNLSSNLIATPDSVYSLSILDNDTLSVSFQGAAFSYSENSGMVYIKVAMSSPVPYPNSFYVTVDTGSAQKDLDYFCADTVLVDYAANSEDTVEVVVQLIEDTLDEGVEQINFNLIRVLGDARLDIRAYTIFIIDDDFVNGISNADLTNGVRLIPNPAAGHLYLIGEEGQYNVFISDLTGRVCLRLGQLESGKSVIDVSRLSSGFYLLHYTFKNEERTLRFVKQ